MPRFSVTYKKSTSEYRVTFIKRDAFSKIYFTIKYGPRTPMSELKKLGVSTISKATRLRHAGQLVEKLLKSGLVS